MRISSHDGPQDVIKLLSKLCDVPEGQVRLSVDDTSMSLAALLPDMMGFCADPEGYKEGIVNLGFTVEVNEAPPRVCMSRTTWTSRAPPPQARMCPSRRRCRGPRRAARHPKLPDRSRRRRTGHGSRLPPMYAHPSQLLWMPCHCMYVQAGTRQPDGPVVAVYCAPVPHMRL